MAHGGTPSAITKSPRPGSDRAIRDLAAEDDHSVSRSDQSNVRDHCLARDGHRCMVTGAWHWHYSGRPANCETAPSEASHIIPFSSRQIARTTDCDMPPCGTQSTSTSQTFVGKQGFFQATETVRKP
ncbi:uncharacterized protein BDV17DRAFT_249148 [Aspergillus undulatus]|uniref:uncharacterized protein n=1 Tax=Aspergillus undulatus TaxID=1810928 RepID=UPI003CCCDE07